MNEDMDIQRKRAEALYERLYLPSDGGGGHSPEQINWNRALHALDHIAGYLGQINEKLGKLVDKYQNAAAPPSK